MIKFTTKLFLILAATLLPTGVWGEDKNVYSASDFGTLSSGYYSLTNGNTYTLQEDIILEGYLLIEGNVTIDLKGHILDRNLTEALTNGFVIRINSNGILTISDTGGNGTIRGGFHKHNSGILIMEEEYVILDNLFCKEAQLQEIDKTLTLVLSVREEFIMSDQMQLLQSAEV